MVLYMLRKNIHHLSMVVVSLVVTFLYFNEFRYNFFAYDSFRYIENLFHGPKTVMLGYNAFRVVSNFMWYPLYWISGFNPLGYNVFNNLLYALNAILVYIFTLRLWERKDLSFLCATIFVMNVAAADAVFWHMSMSTLLCASFYLSTLIAYIQYLKSNRQWLWWTSLGLYLVAMFTKEDAASLPFILVLVDVFYFQGIKNLKVIIKKVIPFCAIIVFYLASSTLVFKMLDIQPETAKFFKFRPLYSLLAGYSSFFISPNGVLRPDNPFIYLTLVAIVLTFIFVKDKRLLLFGYAWIFFTFLPQSLSAIGQFETKYIFNSIGRLLYLPVAGSSIVIAVFLLELKERFSSKIYLGLVAGFLIFFFGINYTRVQRRGGDWRDEAAPVAQFLAQLKKVMPAFPPRSYVYVIDPPTGRAYVQQSLRAFYRNPDITWIVDPQLYRKKSDENAFLITTTWGMNGVEAVFVQQW